MSLILPVRVSGMDSNGQLFDLDACTLDVTATGAKIHGVDRPLFRGAIIVVQHGLNKAKYLVRWIRAGQDGDGGQIGVQLLDQGVYIWGMVIPRSLGDDLEHLQPATPLSASGEDTEQARRSE